MKPTELRIGNRVAYAGIEYSVAAMSSLSLILIDDDGVAITVRSNDPFLEPISINGKLLLNYGFTQHKNWLFCRGCFEISLERYDNWYMCINGGEYLIAPLKHFHDLQNAYQLVTKQELTLQL